MPIRRSLLFCENLHNDTLVIISQLNVLFQNIFLSYVALNYMWTCVMKNHLRALQTSKITSRKAKN